MPVGDGGAQNDAVEGTDLNRQCELKAAPDVIFPISRHFHVQEFPFFDFFFNF